MFINSSKKLIKSLINSLFKLYYNIVSNKNIRILIIVVISMSIFYLYINDSDSFTNSISKKKNKQIYLNTYFFKTEQEKKNGLMHIKEPLGNKGALFKYKNPQKICIWMKNTFIPLDALFLDNKFQVIEMI